MTRNAAELFARIRHAGAAFLGRFCPEAVGDYVAGPNHVLPTGRTARFASGLSVFDSSTNDLDRRRRRGARSGRAGRGDTGGGGGPARPRPQHRAAARAGRRRLTRRA